MKNDILEHEKVTNYSSFEYSELKLLLNSEKCKQILEVATQQADYDVTFPISIELHLTNRCNLKCGWCVDKGIRNDLAEISFSTLENFIDTIQNLQIGLTIEGGGEPTIYPYFDSFIRKAVDKKIELGLITNGVKMFDLELVKHFKWIRVSLDASTREEYIVEKGVDQFDLVLSNIQKSCQNRGNCLIGVGYVLTNRNDEHIISLLEKLDQMGVNYINIRSVEEESDLLVSDKQLQLLAQNIASRFNQDGIKVILNTSLGHEDNLHLPCVAHSLRTIIHADGQVYMCEKRRHDPIILGNINKCSFTDIWQSSGRMESSRKLLDPAHQIGCAACRITKFNKIFYELMEIETKHFI